jgi:carboxylate-amine ligase
MPDKKTDPATHRGAHAFGVSPPLSVGVEEELLLVDDRFQLVPEAQTALDSIPAPLADLVSAEIFTEQIELKTGVCHGADDVLRELRDARRALRDADFGLIGSGLHPSAEEGEPTLVCLEAAL